VVIGASAGGVEALRTIVADLPADLPAAVLIVLHVPRSSPSALPAILGRVTSLRVRSAVDGEPLRHRRVYIAPVDRHLLVIDNQVRLSRGPAENGHRPAIDPLFRSVAHAFGPRAIGVVLTGSRDDGAVGLATICARGGVAVVQDPTDALHSSMPRAAMEHCKPDHVAPVAEIGRLLAEIVRTPAPEPVAVDDPKLAAEVAMSELGPSTTDELFDPAGYGCPACGGSLFKLDGGPVPRYRCRIGHAWSPESLLDELASTMEGALWMALRTAEERASLGRGLAAATAHRLGSSRATRYQLLAADAERAAGVVRALIEEIGAVSGGDIVESGR